MRPALLAAVITMSWVHCGCAILGPSCTARREEGTVAMLSGTVEAGAVAVHDLAYATEGSQNDVRVSWAGQILANGPRLRFFATRADCREFVPPPAANAGECQVLAQAGSTGANVATTLIVTHGRGNPEVLGRPPAYRVWVVGDESQAARYTMMVTYFYGPDC